MPESTQATSEIADAATRAMLALVLTHGLGPRLIARAVDKCGSAMGVLGATAATLGEVEGISKKNAGKLKRAIDDAAAPGGAAERELALAAKHNAAVVAIDGPGYPALLKVIPDAPPVLWVKGRLSADDALSLAIVGSRKCSHYGREQADLIANGLAHAGVTVVSGGAYGIDIAAHEGALRAAKGGAAASGGRTVAVLGSGLAKPYPSEHVGLLRAIVEEGGACGAVVSEFPMLTEPRPENFLRRNRIISGLSLGVLVVEAGKRSGALSTARRCVDEHGRELMALPGRVDSAYAFGCHQIIREGWGQLVTGVSDILDVIGGEAPMLDAARELCATPDSDAAALSSKRATASPMQASPESQKILETLDEPRSLDEIAAWTGLAAGQVQGELTMLEIRGAVKRQGGLFVRRR
ncbi:DNA-processing protein DprA [Phycisphaeraceae bacterium D3-23]